MRNEESPAAEILRHGLATDGDQRFSRFLWRGIRAVKSTAMLCLCALAPVARPALLSCASAADRNADPANLASAGGCGQCSRTAGDGRRQSAARSINMMWMLLAGFLVMFMQAGFAMVETGLIRSRNVSHTTAMNLMIYSIAVLGFFFCGFAILFGGQGLPSFAAATSLGSEFSDFAVRQRVRTLRHAGIPALRLADAMPACWRMFVFHLALCQHRRHDRHGHFGRTVEILGLRDLWRRDDGAHLSRFRQLGLGRRLVEPAGSEFRAGPWRMSISPARRSSTWPAESRPPSAGDDPRPADRQV